MSRITPAKMWQNSDESLDPMALECRGGRKTEIAERGPGSPTPG